MDAPQYILGFSEKPPKHMAAAFDGSNRRVKINSLSAPVARLRSVDVSQRPKHNKQALMIGARIRTSGYKNLLPTCFLLLHRHTMSSIAKIERAAHYVSCSPQNTTLTNPCAVSSLSLLSKSMHIFYMPLP